MARSLRLPERTVDALFAYEVLTALPSAQIWSPANQAGQDMIVDHEISTPDHVRLFVFECKTFYADPTKNDDEMYVRIDRPQLEQYAHRAPGTLYLLPAHSLPGNPADRGACGCSGCGCWACDGPEQRRTVTAVSGYPWHKRFQFWFSHWAWCVPALELKDFIDSQPRKRNGVVLRAGDYRDLNARDRVLEGIPAAIRLCHLLHWMNGDAAAGHQPDLLQQYRNEERGLMAEAAIQAALQGVDAKRLPPLAAGRRARPVTRTLVSYRSGGGVSRDAALEADRGDRW